MAGMTLDANTTLPKAGPTTRREAVEGIVDRVREILQFKHGPDIFQPCGDVRRVPHRNEIFSNQGSCLIRVFPCIAIPTRLPLFPVFKSGVLSAGFILALGPAPEKINVRSRSRPCRFARGVGRARHAVLLSPN